MLLLEHASPTAAGSSRKSSIAEVPSEKKREKRAEFIKSKSLYTLMSSFNLAKMAAFGAAAVGSIGFVNYMSASNEVSALCSTRQSMCRHHFLKKEAHEHGAYRSILQFAN